MASFLHLQRDGGRNYLNRRFSRESWSTAVQPISFIPLDLRPHHNKKAPAKPGPSILQTAKADQRE
jgi:hypothetical protein